VAVSVNHSRLLHHFRGYYLEILHEHGLGVELLTKGKNATRDFDILGENDRFARTLTFVSPELSLEWEPKAALPEERIDSLREAHVRGIRTWVSLEPVVDPAQTLELIRLTYPFVDLYQVGTLNYLPNETDWSGFLKDVTALLKSLNKDYIIKQDLAKYS
jgi:DNA repair photolyase